jgi:hypothetical protein
MLSIVYLPAVNIRIVVKIWEEPLGKIAFTNDQSSRLLVRP